MSWNIYFFCWTSWISRCFLAAVFFQTKITLSCPRVRESTLKDGSAVAKPRPMNLVSTNLLSAKKDPPQDLSDPNSPVNQGLDQSGLLARSRKLLRDQPKPNNVFSREATTWCSIFYHLETGAERWIFKLGSRQESERITNSESRSCTSTICRSPIIGTLRKSSRICRKVESRRTRTTNWYRCVEDRRINLGTLSTRMKAAIHLGPNYTENLEVFRCTNFKALGILFHTTLKIFLHHQVETLNVKTIERTSLSWTRSTLFMVKWTKARVRVYSHSVLCLGNMSDHLEANRR